jgi:hypothetical protein
MTLPPPPPPPGSGGIHYSQATLPSEPLLAALLAGCSSSISNLGLLSGLTLEIERGEPPPAPGFLKVTFPGIDNRAGTLYGRVGEAGLAGDERSGMSSKASGSDDAELLTSRKGCRSRSLAVGRCSGSAARHETMSSKADMGMPGGMGGWCPCATRSAGETFASGGGGVQGAEPEKRRMRMHPMDQMSLAWGAGVIMSVENRRKWGAGMGWWWARDEKRRRGRCEGARGGKKEGEKEGEEDGEQEGEKEADDAWRRERMARNVKRGADRGSRCRQRPVFFCSVR